MDEPESDGLGVRQVVGRELAILYRARNNFKSGYYLPDSIVDRRTAIANVQHDWDSIA